MKLNFKRGFTRVYLVLWVAWAGTVLVVPPLGWARYGASERAAHSQHLAKDKQEGDVESARHEQKLVELYSEGAYTFWGSYRFFWRPWLTDAFLLPALLYGAIAGGTELSIRIGRWIRKGFIDH